MVVVAGVMFSEVPLPMDVPPQLPAYQCQLVALFRCPEVILSVTIVPSQTLFAEVERIGIVDVLQGIISIRLGLSGYCPLNPLKSSFLIKTPVNGSNSNKTPNPEVPPCLVIPYNFPLDACIRLPYGALPLLLLKSIFLVKTPVNGSNSNITPAPKPPEGVIPYIFSFEACIRLPWG